MPRIYLAGVLAPLALVSEASRALACPDCPTARMVSQAICAGDMWQNVAIVGGPFIVFALVALGVHRLGRPDAAVTPR
jgi:hypothetical protein